MTRQEKIAKVQEILMDCSSQALPFPYTSAGEWFYELLQDAGVVPSDGNTSLRGASIHSVVIDDWDLDVVEDDSGLAEWKPYKPTAVGCGHIWETYTGLYESFQHCKKCGVKK